MRIAINTGGGDAPGLHAVIRAATHGAINLGWRSLAFGMGYEGLLEPERYDGDALVPLTLERVRSIARLRQAGTVLGTVNRANPFRRPEKGSDGLIMRLIDRICFCSAFVNAKIDALYRRWWGRFTQYRSRTRAQGASRDRRSEDDRQRSGSDSDDLRISNGRWFRNRVP